MAHSPVTPRYLLGAVVLLSIALFSVAESQEIPTSLPLPNPNFNCTPDLYVQLPYQVYYVNPGDRLCVVCNSTAISIQSMMEAFVAFVEPGSSRSVCQNVEGCTVDAERDELCFNDGIPEASFGSYICQHAIDINNICEVPFNITKAIAPVYSFGSTGSGIMLEEADDTLTLMPSITDVGLPPAEYVWEYSPDNTDFVPLSNQSSYEKDPVEPSGRGYYRFSAVNIANQANPLQLTYEVTVDFSPIITLTTVPENTNPTTTNGVTVICSVTSHPQIQENSLTLTYNGIPSGANVDVPSNIQEDLAYHAEAKTTISGCPFRMYTCSARNAVSSLAQSSLTICNVVPVIEGFMVDTSRCTNTTVTLAWTVSNQDQGVTEYLIQYRTLGEEYSMITHNVMTEQPFFTVRDLQPRTFYEFRVRATNTAGDSDFTPIVNFTTFSEPTVQPYGVWAERRRFPTGVEEIKLGWSAVPSTNLYIVTQYEVMYYSSDASSARSLILINALKYTLPTNMVAPQQTYFFQVRAVGDYGAGPLSAAVESPPLVQASQNPYFNISITSLQVNGDQAYLTWSTSGGQTPTGIFVNISRFDSDSQTLLSIGDFTLDQNTMAACFDNLNDTDTYQYQFCITASLPDGTMPHTCAFPTTATDDLPASEIECISVTDRVESLPLPLWAIIVIAASSGFLAVLVLCGCVLCVATQCRGTRVEIKEEEPYSSFSLDRNLQGTINGGFPSRPVSPPRSCITYRRDKHHHQMDWHMNNLMDGPATVV